jgi:hypothetical protein
MLDLPFFRKRERGALVLGRQGKHMLSPPFQVSASTRTAHLYVIGMSGKGRSKLLEWCLNQDIASGRGCGLIDPHSLLVDDLLKLLITRGVLDNQNIRRQLIYVDPARTDYVIPFNVLARGRAPIRHRCGRAGGLSTDLARELEGSAPFL